MIHPYRCYVCSLRLNRILKEDCKRRSENKIALPLPLPTNTHLGSPNWNNGNVFHTHTLCDSSLKFPGVVVPQKLVFVPPPGPPLLYLLLPLFERERAERNSPVCAVMLVARERELYSGLDAVFFMFPSVSLVDVFHILTVHF